jgi:hypothetical protein
VRGRIERLGFSWIKAVNFPVAKAVPSATVERFIAPFYLN